MEKNVMKKIEAHFVARMLNAGFKLGSVKYRQAEADFFSGAMAAMTAPHEVKAEAGEAGMDYQQKIGEAMPPKWVFGIMRGGIEFEEGVERKQK